MSQGLTASPLEISPNGLYTSSALPGYGISKDRLQELNEFFGLFHVLGGGTEPRVYLGKTILESLERRGRQERVDVVPGPPARDLVREWRKLKG